jgi:hypothetical protein
MTYEDPEMAVSKPPGEDYALIGPEIFDSFEYALQYINEEIGFEE